MTINIKFTNTFGYTDILKPVPAYTMIPEWYKKNESYVGGEKKPSGIAGNLATIKKCMPVFDSMTAGYLILLPADVWVSYKDAVPIDPTTRMPIPNQETKRVQYFEWSNFNLLDFHPVEQAELHPLKNEHPYPKWMNPWSIKTPSGYSLQIIQPVHRDLPFTIFPGVVDTDKYYAPINFPMVINDPNFEGLIPKGTPIAQVIPFKREKWAMEFGTKSDISDQENVTIELMTRFFDKYKNTFRSIKEYK